MKLELHTQPEVPLEAEVITPHVLEGLSESAAGGLTVFHGNRQEKLGDFFKISGKSDGLLEVEGDLSGVKLIGSDMSAGQVTINGNVGTHLGAGMSGGDIEVNGDAGDRVGREISGGRIVVKGNAGHMVGSAVRGSATGIQGGEIIIHGNARNEVGNGMRRGLIVIGGDSGDFTGVGMLAGTIIVLGQMGIRTGASMQRGTIVSMHRAELLPTFTFACAYRPSFLRLVLLQLRDLGLPVDDAHLDGQYQRWNGDSVELNKCEILL